MRHFGIHKLQVTPTGWEVSIDGYSIPYETKRPAVRYFQYIQNWAKAGELIGYDPKKGLIWKTIPLINRNQTAKD